MTNGGRGLNSKREAEDAIRIAFKEVTEREDAKKLFAQVCLDVHQRKFLSDGEIARVIGGAYSRSNIQQLRKKAEKSK